MSSDQHTRGFLPPTTSDEHHRQPPSTTTTSTGNNPHHLHGFTALPLPQFQTSPPSPTTTTISDVSNITQESKLAADLARAFFKLCDAVAATTTGNTQNPIRRTKSDITSSVNQTTTGKRNPLRRTMSETISTGHQEQQKITATATPPPGARTDREESPQIKRLKKMEEVVTEIEQRCSELTRECESEITEERDGDDNPSQATTEQAGVSEECLWFKRLNDGGFNIRLSCSCGKSFEMLHNHSGCFYRLM